MVVARAPEGGRILPSARAAPAPAGTLTLIHRLESTREIAVLAITVHFAPERRHRNPPTAAARHLRGNAGGAGRPLPRKRISEVAKRRKPVVAKRWESEALYPRVCVRHYNLPLLLLKLMGRVGLYLTRRGSGGARCWAVGTGWERVHSTVLAQSSVRFRGDRSGPGSVVVPTRRIWRRSKENT